MPTYTREIRYDRATKDFALYLNGELVAYARTYLEGEATLDALVYELLENQATEEETMAARDGESALPAVIVSQPAPRRYVLEIDGMFSLATSVAEVARAILANGSTYACDETVEEGAQRLIARQVAARTLPAPEPVDELAALTAELYDETVAIAPDWTEAQDRAAEWAAVLLPDMLNLADEWDAAANQARAAELSSLPTFAVSAAD